MQSRQHAYLRGLAASSLAAQQHDVVRSHSFHDLLLHAHDRQTLHQWFNVSQKNVLSTVWHANRLRRLSLAMARSIVTSHSHHLPRLCDVWRPRDLHHPCTARLLRGQRRGLY